MSMASPETRWSLVVRLQDERDEAAWHEFIVEYEPFLLTYLHRRGLQEADARDVAQQVMTSICQSVANWKPDGRPGAFRRWMATIARHAAIKFMHRKSRQPDSGGGTAFLARMNDVASVDNDTAAQQEYQQAVFAWAVSRVKDEFRESTWTAFWETLVVHRPIDVVAQELGLSTGAVYMARSRVMARLRTQVAQLLDADGTVPLNEDQP
ncbi:MAG: sigma-70 family RNA polymerase sigma factor [Planctomycetaceae bacterium]|nr:sigma-70 family RNA polymerase sigma factor [Planctomycetaceae bacterium]